MTYPFQCGPYEATKDELRMMRITKKKLSGEKLTRSDRKFMHKALEEYQGTLLLQVKKDLAAQKRAENIPPRNYIFGYG